MLHDVSSFDEDSSVILIFTCIRLVFACNRERVLDFDRLRCGFDDPLSGLLLLIFLLLFPLLQTAYLLQTLHYLLANRRVSKINNLVWNLSGIGHRIRRCRAALCVVMFRLGSRTLHSFYFQVLDHADKSVLLILVCRCLLQ